MLKKTALVMLFGIGIASTAAPASADVGLFFNSGQQYYGQNYYGLYPYTSDYYWYDPYYRPYYDGPYYYTRSYHYHAPYNASYSYRQCTRFHTYNPATHTYVGKDGLPHHCP